MVMCGSNELSLREVISQLSVPWACCWKLSAGSGAGTAQGVAVAAGVEPLNGAAFPAQGTPYTHKGHSLKTGNSHLFALESSKRV